MIFDSFINIIPIKVRESFETKEGCQLSVDQKRPAIMTMRVRDTYVRFIAACYFFHFFNILIISARVVLFLGAVEIFYIL